MNDSLDSLVNNLKFNLYNTKCKHCMKCKDCKKNVKSARTVSLNGVKCVRLVKNYQVFVKNVTKFANTVNVVLISMKKLFQYHQNTIYQKF